MGLQTASYKTFVGNYVKKYSFDFVIGSVHLIDGKDPHQEKEIQMEDSIRSIGMGLRIFLNM